MRLRLGQTVVIAAAWALAVMGIVWLVSYHEIRGWRWVTAPHVTWLANSGDGLLDLRRTERPPIEFDAGRWAYVSPEGPRGLDLPGLVVQRTVNRRWRVNPGEVARGIPNPPDRMRFDSVVWHVRVWYWLPCLVLASLPAAWVDRRRRRARLARRAAAGQCAACGYDCRASPDRCPECGAATVAGVQPPAEGRRP